MPPQKYSISSSEEVPVRYIMKKVSSTKIEKISRSKSSEDDTSSEEKDNTSKKKISSSEDDTSSEEEEDNTSKKKISSSEDDTSSEEEKDNISKVIFKRNAKPNKINTNFIPTTVANFLSPEDISSFALAMRTEEIIPQGVIIKTKKNINNTEIRRLALIPDLHSIDIKTAKNLDASSLIHFFTYTKLDYLHISNINRKNNSSLRYLNRLHTLKIEDSDLYRSILPRLNSVTTLVLDFIKADEKFFESIANLPNLTSLTLNICTPLEVGKESLAIILPVLKKLERFELIGWNYLSRDIIVGFSANLQHLALRNCGRIISEVTTQIATLINLTSLDFSNCIAVERFNDLLTLTSLSNLNLSSSIKTSSFGDRDLSTIAQFKKLNTLNLTSSHISTLQPLTELTQLQRLTLDNCNRLGEGSSFISQLKSLQYYSMSGSTINYLVLEHIGLLPELEELHLNIYQNYQSIGSEGYVHFLTNPKLRVLELSGNNVDEEDIKAISKLSNLEYLSIPIYYGEEVIWDDSSLEYLSTLAKLTYLDISGNTKITATGIKSLRKLKYLSRLIISRCSSITKKVLAILATFPNLKVLDISYCDINKVDIEEFKKKNSHIHVDY